MLQLIIKMFGGRLFKERWNSCCTKCIREVV